VIYLIHGTDEAQVQSAARKLFNELSPPDADDFANDIVDGIADNSESAFQLCNTALQALQTLPFFGGQKIVWLKNANFLTDDRTGKAQRTQEGIAGLLETMQNGLPEGTTFIISSTGIDKRRAFWKWLSKNAEIQNFDRVDTSKDGWEEIVAPLVLAEARSLSLSFEDEALDLFVALAGEDTAQIRSELEKLCLYLSPETIVTTEAVNLLVPRTHKAIVWEIGRAIEGRQSERAIELIDRQLEKGENAIGLIRVDEKPSVPTGRYDYKKFESAIQTLSPSSQAALPRKKDGGLNVWGLFQAVGKAGQWSSSSLRKGLDYCLEADHSLVSSQLDHRLVLHRLVARLMT